MALPHSPHCFTKALNRESQYFPEKKSKVFQSFTYHTSFWRKIILKNITFNRFFCQIEARKWLTLCCCRYTLSIINVFFIRQSQLFFRSEFLPEKQPASPIFRLENKITSDWPTKQTRVLFIYLLLHMYFESTIRK